MIHLQLVLKPYDMGQEKFLTLKEINKGAIKFGDNATMRITRKDILNLDNGKTKKHLIC